MRRRKRRRGTWFPVNGHNVIGTEIQYDYADLRVDTGSVPVSNAEPPAQFLAPVLPDFSEQQGTGAIVTNPQLQDIVSGQTWVLDRFVGKLHLQCNGTGSNPNPALSWQSVYVVAGLFVARAEDDAPALVALDQEEVEPQQKDNSMNPWIWRRSWILGNPVSTGNFAPASTFTLNIWPMSTGQYGSVMDGAHVDSKVNRYIPREHRLWFVTSARGYSPGAVELSSTEAQPNVAGLLDYRIFGRLARSKNLSTF